MLEASENEQLNKEEKENQAKEAPFLTFGNYRLDKVAFYGFGTILALVAVFWLFKASVDARIADIKEENSYLKQQVREYKEEVRAYNRALGNKEILDTIKNHQ